MQMHLVLVRRGDVLFDGPRGSLTDGIAGGAVLLSLAQCP